MSVYIAQLGELPYCKIGASDDVVARLRLLNQHVPFEMQLRYIANGGLADERALQHHFRYLRLQGEWFHMSAEIKAMCQGAEQACSSYLSKRKPKWVNQSRAERKRAKQQIAKQFDEGESITTLVMKWGVGRDTIRQAVGEFSRFCRFIPEVFMP